jgi:hypothetical protein
MVIPRESEEGTEYVIETETVEVNESIDIPDETSVAPFDYRKVSKVSKENLMKFNQLANKRKQEYQPVDGKSKNKKIIDMLLKQK